MAIKVNGTTVIDDSRNLVNIASGAGSSTTNGDVGTYLACANASGSSVSYGGTVSGSNLKLNNTVSDSPFGQSGFSYYNYSFASTSISGTWRLMGGSVGSGTNPAPTGLWVRIS